MTTTGPALPENEEQKIRYMPCVNYSGEWIPPFACMQRLQFTMGYTVDAQGTDAWIVNKPGVYRQSDGTYGDAYDSQNGGHYVFNGPEAIPPGKSGRCTEDYPTRALILASEVPQWWGQTGTAASATIVSGSDRLLGPRKGSWLLWANPDLNSTNYYGTLSPSAQIASQQVAFNFLAYSSQKYSAFGSDYKVVHVQKRSPQLTAIWLSARARYGGQGPFGPAVGAPTYYSGDGGYGEWADIEYQGMSWTSHYNSGIAVVYDGTYSISYSGTLYSQTAPQDTLLKMGMVVRSGAGTSSDPNTWKLSTLEMARYQGIEIDNYGNEIARSKENVASSIIMRLRRNDVLLLTNTSSYEVVLLYPRISIQRIGDYTTPATL